MKKENHVFRNTVFAALVMFISTSCNSVNNSNNGEKETIAEAPPTLTQVWKTDTLFTGSESTLYNPNNDIIYVSCGNTDPSAKDGNGFIALLNPDGSVNNMKWLSGLNAPKGMTILNGKLYVTDIDEVKVIDIMTASIEKTIPITGAKFLNDFANDGTSTYFSDSQTGIIYSLNEKGDAKAVINHAEGINGLECFEGKLYTLDKDGLKKYNITDFTPTLLNTEVTGGDGLVILNDSTFIASRWVGEIYLIKGSETSLLVDTKGVESNTADIGFIPDKNLVIVPTFMKNEVVAYTLK